MTRYPKYYKLLEDCIPYLKFLAKDSTDIRSARMTLVTADIETLYSLQAVIALGECCTDTGRKSPSKNAVMIFRTWRKQLGEAPSAVKQTVIDDILSKDNYKDFLRRGMGMLDLKWTS